MDVCWWLAQKTPTFRVEWEYQRENEVAVSIRDANQAVFRAVVDPSVLQELEAEIHRFRERNGLLHEDNGSTREA